MDNLYILIGAIEYIENNICEPITQKQIAEACYTSLSNLRRLFRYAFNCSIREYIVKRRIRSACRDLAERNMNVCDIAFKYQYNSHEVFTRAFIKQCGVTPSEYRKNPGSVLCNGKNAGNNPEISDLYELLKNFGGSYIVCVKISGLTDILHKYGRAAEDNFLAAAAACLAYGDDLAAFRISRDVFVIMTASNDLTEAENIVSVLELQNGTAIKSDGHEITLAFDLGIMRLPESDISFTDLTGRFSPFFNRAGDSDDRL